MSRYITANNTAARYPTDGRGGASATDTESETAAARAVLIKHFLVTGQDAVTPVTITIMEHDGTTVVFAFIVPGADVENFIGKTVPIGIGLNEGFSVKTSDAATNGLVVYDFT